MKLHMKTFNHGSKILITIVSPKDWGGIPIGKIIEFINALNMFHFRAKLHARIFFNLKTYITTIHKNHLC